MIRYLSIIGVAFLLGCVLCHSHGHSHDEIDEPPSFKYSRQANEGSHSHAHSHGDHHHHHAHDHHHHHAHDHHHNHNHNHDHHHHEEIKSKPQQDKFSIASYALLSTLLISIAPFLILFAIPLNSNSAENQSFLRSLLSLAAGSLLGDAFLHLIPHALHDHSHDDISHESMSHTHIHSHDSNHDHHDHSAQTYVGLCVLSGIITFLLVEKLVRHFKGGHTHSHEIKPKKEVDDKKKKSKEKTQDSPKEEHNHEKDDLKIAGYLNLVADFAHNFTDGLAIGASFLTGQTVGLVTTLTILLHEVPHEIGDFAILIQSGCSKNKAIFLQLVTAIGALSGTLISLMFESAISGFATSFILPFTAGGFIYIATVSIIPELKENSNSLFQSIKEIIFLIIGIGLMVLIAYLE